MKKPPKPKAKRKPDHNPQSPQQQERQQTPENESNVALQTLKTGWGKLIAVLAVFGTFQLTINTYDFFRTIYRDTIPEVHAIGPNNNPFNLPFSVKNNSKIFDMSEVSWACGIDSVRNKQGGGISNLPIYDGQEPKVIPTEKTSNFNCRISIPEVVSAKIHPIVKYRTLGVEREFRSRDFTWYADSVPPRWVESD